MFLTSYSVVKVPLYLINQADCTTSLTFIPRTSMHTHFIHFNKLGESCNVIFMYSYIHFAPISYDSSDNPLPRTYTEMLSVQLVKEHC